jgi:MinD-like ATPase involved in chromosome partitioning or flagellar assembly
MSVIALASAKGAPGVTTAAVALGAAWPGRALVAECDPAGGDLAARFGLAPDPSLLSLAAAARRGDLAPEQVWAHTQRLPRGLQVLTGQRSAEQARALGVLWPLLPAAFGTLGVDVVVDCGRLGPEPPTELLLRSADATLLLTRPTADGVMHLVDCLEVLGRRGAAAAVVLVGEHPFAGSAVNATLAAEGVAGRVVGVLADDRRGAGMLCGEPGNQRWLERGSPLIRSARALTGTLRQRPTVTAAARQVRA